MQATHDIHWTTASATVSTTTENHQDFPRIKPAKCQHRASKVAQIAKINNFGDAYYRYTVKLGQKDPPCNVINKQNIYWILAASKG